jgi:hypothetical protein
MKSHSKFYLFILQIFNGSHFFDELLFLWNMVRLFNGPICLVVYICIFMVESPNIKFFVCKNTILHQSMSVPSRSVPFRLNFAISLVATIPHSPKVYHFLKLENWIRHSQIGRDLGTKISNGQF